MNCRLCGNEMMEWGWNPALTGGVNGVTFSISEWMFDIKSIHVTNALKHTYKHVDVVVEALHSYANKLGSVELESC